MWPKTVSELLLLLLFVVPGFVYQAVRISVRGRLPLDVDLSTRLVRAIVSSAVFGLVYLVVFGDLLVQAARGEGFAFRNVRVGAAMALGLGIVVPALGAVARVPQWPWVQRLGGRLPQVTKYDPTPTGWDKAFQNSSECFIRILTKDGTWIAGYYGGASYATSYPEDQQLFLEKAHAVSDTGEIGDEVENSLGVLVQCSEIQLLQIVAPVYGVEGST
ncbi:DUF6338 family protein [Knoellia locipacati]|uniref:DUF6338 family protein n=1 Tax=Knoellia locipacati TaxID=882824 RepID=UPI00384CDF49